MIRFSFYNPETPVNLFQQNHAHQLVWIEDESNQDLRYDRNFLRQRLLPELYQRWPHFAEATARSAEASSGA